MALEKETFFESRSRNLCTFENMRKGHQSDILSPSVVSVYYPSGMETKKKYIWL